MAKEEGDRKLAAILSADVVGYSKLMADDERATVNTLKEYRLAIARVIERHKGRVVNLPGDNILADFPSAVEAVQGAVEIQKVLEGRNLELPADRRMEFRIGVNLGDVIEEADGTIYGDGVNIAARMEALAETGGICISNTIYDAVEGKLDFGFDFLGEQQVKNIAKPVPAYRVQAASSIGPTAPQPRKGISPLAAVGMTVIAGVVVGIVVWQVMERSRPAPVPEAVTAAPSEPEASVETASDVPANAVLALELTFQNHLLYNLVEQNVFVERKPGAGVVHRVTSLEMQRFMDKPLYAAGEPVIEAPFDHGEVGPYAKGPELGFTLADWLAGTGTAIYKCDHNVGTLNAQLEGLVPDGLYTMWYFISPRPPNNPFSHIDLPLGDRDGSQSVFTADGDGRTDFNVVFKPCLQLSGRQVDTGLAIAWHSNGKVYGGWSGPLSMVSHVQAFAVFPVEGR